MMEGDAKGKQMNGVKYDVSHFQKKVNKSIGQEATKPIETKVIGHIPVWLKGSLLRNGPGKFEVGNDRFNHLFDGFSFLHRFIMEEGGMVKYQGRFLRSDVYEKAMKHQRLVFDSFGTPARHPDPCKTLFQRVFSFFNPEFPDNCNVNWMKLGDEYYALTESPKIKKIDVNTLDVTDSVHMDKIVGVHTATAHPHTGRDGTTYNLGTAMSRKSKYCVIKIPPTNKNGKTPVDGTSIMASIPSATSNPAYYHSFGITENYIVFLEQPLRLNMLKFMVGRVIKTPMTECFDYHRNAKARFHLIRRSDGMVMATHYSADAFFCFHHVNAYETDDSKHVVIDMCCYDDDKIMKDAYMENILNNNLSVAQCRLRRYVLPLTPETQKKGCNLVTMVSSKASATLGEDGVIHCNPEQLCDVSLELPQINYAGYNGRDYRYTYGIGEHTELLYKIDVKTGESLSWSSLGCFPSEPVFVPAPTKKAEDDGVILSCVADVNDEDRRPYLLVLDAHTFKEIARAIIPLPMTMFGFHGMFVEDL